MKKDIEMRKGSDRNVNANESKWKNFKNNKKLISYWKQNNKEFVKNSSKKNLKFQNKD